MKPQSVQKLFAFIIVIFSFFSSPAQCKGNKILVCHTSRACDCIGCCTICRCVSPSHTLSYLRDGWTLSNPPVATKSDKTPSHLFSISVINATSINVALTDTQSVSLKIYDITGKLIKTLVDGRNRRQYWQESIF